MANRIRLQESTLYGRILLAMGETFIFLFIGSKFIEALCFTRDDFIITIALLGLLLINTQETDVIPVHIDIFWIIDLAW